MTISIALIYQDLLGTYGDRGNALAIAHRLKIRGIESEIIDVKPNDSLPNSCDLYLLGGGEDKAQTLATKLLNKNKKTIQQISSNAYLIAICAGFQILGKQFPIEDSKLHPGLEIIDATTKSGTPRIIGEVVTQCNIEGIGLLTGFENHGGRTQISNTDMALGIVKKGFGNGIDISNNYVDGYFTENIICTYLHGPLFARNPKLCDYVISKILGTDAEDLPEINNDLAKKLHSERLKAVL